LFAGTVEENIRYGRRDATKEDINRAIQAVYADEFIQYMPEGIQTNVHERGGRLSTGQRQLVCFARALLANPQILILDEATSSVDAYTEAVIQDALETLFKNRTSIIVAHRLSTVMNADRIIVLDKGKIVEEGTHHQLLQLNGKYKTLYEIYFKHQSPDWQPPQLQEQVDSLVTA
jgi:ABC-type multidrug transport system fused ATPase/permease subunit